MPSSAVPPGTYSLSLRDALPIYLHVAARLVAEGYAVYAIDHRGHGRSEGSRRSEEHTSELQSLRHLVCRRPLCHRGRTLFPYATLFRSTCTSPPAWWQRATPFTRSTIVVTAARRAHADRKSTRLNSSHLGISYAVVRCATGDVLSFPTRRSSDLPARRRPPGGRGLRRLRDRPSWSRPLGGLTRADRPDRQHGHRPRRAGGARGRPASRRPELSARPQHGAHARAPLRAAPPEASRGDDPVGTIGGATRDTRAAPDRQSVAIGVVAPDAADRDRPGADQSRSQGGGGLPVRSARAPREAPCAHRCRDRRSDRFVP